MQKGEKMLYSLTEKLKFDTNPQIEIKGETITVKSDAETVLKLMDILKTKGELDASIASVELLFSKDDQKKIKKLNLQFGDYITLLEVAVSLALGEDPEKESGE